MREIKFRAYDTKRRLWVNPAFLCIGLDGEHWGIVNERVILPADEEELKHVVFLQYTGLKDSKGKEIYEGDILLTDKAGWKAKVVFSASAFILLDSSGRFSAEPDWDKCEIIGNIYENPELISPAWQSGQQTIK